MHNSKVRTALIKDKYKEEVNTMSILVVGGLGAIGSFVVRNLVERGEVPVVYDKGHDLRLIKDIINRIKFVHGDVLDWANIVATFRDHKVDRIIYTVALMPPVCAANPYVAVEVNIRGFANVMEAAKIFKVVRFVFASSIGVYAPAIGKYGHPFYEPMDEDYTKSPSNLYAGTKFFCERYGLQYVENYGLDFIALRFAGTYGPGKLTHGAFAGPSRLIDDVVQGRQVNIAQGGNQKTDMVYNRDIGRALVLACYAANLEHRQFNIGTGKASSLLEFVEAIRKAVPEASIEVGPGLDSAFGPGRYCVLDIGRAKRELGYEPKYSLEDGVRDYVELLQQLHYFEIV